MSAPFCLMMYVDPPPVQVPANDAALLGEDAGASSAVLAPAGETCVGWAIDA
jgi:hypothetical protein